MTIFFDTNVLIDNIFNNEPIKELFELSKARKITIYISEMVLWECEKHFIENINSEIGRYNKALGNLSKLISNKNKKFVSNERTIKYFFNNMKYKLIKNYKIEISNFDHKNIIDSMINRYIESKAPFHNKGDNFKDYIIWESYREIINKNKEEEYIFISDNINDFSNNKANVHTNEGLYEGHDDFYKDINIKKENLKFYRKINGFIRGNKEYKKIYKMYLFEKFGLDRNSITILIKLLKIIKVETVDFCNKQGYQQIEDIEILDNSRIVDKGGDSVEVNVKVIQTDISSNSERKKIKTKCIFTIDVKNLKFSIDSIEGFEKSHNKNC